MGLCQSCLDNEMAYLLLFNNTPPKLKPALVGEKCNKCGQIVKERS